MTYASDIHIACNCTLWQQMPIRIHTLMSNIHVNQYLVTHAEISDHQESDGVQKDIL